ncbi:TonB-dependent receptor plug domain-containing protein [Sphingomonas zeae]|uniref:TonB-dependent receptor n=1 Tax=Sphingomonas zeae TaxID=1646122 RepID=A0A7Y6EHP5_9SPHN|nr:TonB-dependent receptor [Sphingomonas zeae]MBB4049522.1 iron complex outermembrane receptor protein [Sphingomonas zeae]NUU48188.1 TonB-dependent receptor [Sphingomonas zeae]
MTSASVIRAALLRETAASAILPVALMGGLLIASPAAAQDNGSPAQSSAAPKTSTDSADTNGKDIVVTGTLFRRTDTETPSPVTILSADTLKKAGINNVSDAVRSISADSSGSIPTAFANGFGAGSSAVSLRGLTVNSTLTLIDGMRTANYPLSDDGQRSFVDLNTIPDAIVDRVEVLKDGASSSYGADAIGGVVNIIMKKEITGVAGTLEGGVTQRGDGGEQRATLTLGTGKLKERGFNVYISGEYQHDDPIWSRNRGFPFNTADLTRIGGDNNQAGSVVPGSTTSALVAPTTQMTPGNILSGSGAATGPFQILNPNGCTGTTLPVSGALGSGCTQNTVADYGQIAPEQTRFGVTGHATVQVNDQTQAYLMASYYQNEVLAAGGPANIRSINPINTQNIILPAILANGQLNPNNPYAASGQPAMIRYLFGDIPASSDYKNHVLRAAAGIDGAFGNGWTYSVSGTIAHSWLDMTQNGYLNLAALTNAINNGTYNFVDPTQNSAAVRSALSPTVHTQATTDLDMIQGVITKEVVQLPGGPLQVGVGGSFRYEAQNDPNQNPNLTTLGLNQFSAIGHRTVESGYFEINAPILTSLEIDGSGRYDHYQEGYNRFSPKIGVKFMPFKQLALRGTFSKGFRAPSFAETSGSVIGFTSSKAPCSVQVQHGATASGSNCTGGSAYNQSYSIGFNTVGNPNIKPELSQSFTAGAVVQPTPWLSFTADYYNIKKTDVISGGPLSNQALAAFYGNGTMPAGYSVTPDVIDPAFPNAPLRALFVNSPFANAAALKTSGIDVSAQVQLHRDDLRFTSRAEATYILHYLFKPSADQPYTDFVGTQSPYVTSSGAGTPQWRGNWQNSVDYGPYSLTATTYYVSGYKAVGFDQFGTMDCNGGNTYQGSDPNFNCHVRRFIDVDLTGSVKVNDKFTFYANVINLTDAKAPLNAGNYAATNYNPTYTQIGAVGRTFRFGANFRF